MSICIHRWGRRKAGQLASNICTCARVWQKHLHGGCSQPSACTSFKGSVAKMSHAPLLQDVLRQQSSQQRVPSDRGASLVGHLIWPDRHVAVAAQTETLMGRHLCWLTTRSTSDSSARPSSSCLETSGCCCLMRRRGG